MFLQLSEDTWDKALVSSWHIFFWTEAFSISIKHIMENASLRWLRHITEAQFEMSSGRKRKCQMQITCFLVMTIWFRSYNQKQQTNMWLTNGLALHTIQFELHTSKKNYPYRSPQLPSCLAGYYLLSWMPGLIFPILMLSVRCLARSFDVIYSVSMFTASFVTSWLMPRNLPWLSPIYFPSLLLVFTSLYC